MVFAKLAQALEKAGQPITGEGLLKMRKQMTSFDVVGGRMEFLPNGTVSMPLQLNEVDDGNVKVTKAMLSP